MSLTKATATDNEPMILVNEKDEEIGIQDKLSVHQSGLLHRAFSVFIFNTEGKLILQQRADTKYHSPGLWTNTCCSHPRPEELTLDACKRRLKEEMGMVVEPEFSFSFIYKYQFTNGLTEHEFDHVFIGISNDQPVLNKDEVKSWRYIGLNELESEILIHPENYTPWLKICLPKLKKQITKSRFKYDISV
ncbi:isopentenyl-diphosphate Delta-isomerase [Daejeonella sp. H1SJ63]|jgi:isopentenyl-diphosphate delta-isomerase|uniref:isopentenyl-diphosphate Delta-isomerase n=1 Tax=Daejeonella sp. H1SJ63 TaxID=3034145 RepID=UPI0023EBDEBD|nr:isopentenyl-diphosphate Delta-isomerase [Daejeonella sp. H1SJ63]